jgi:hypothetical protein
MALVTRWSLRTAALGQISASPRPSFTMMWPESTPITRNPYKLAAIACIEAVVRGLPSVGNLNVFWPPI